MTTLRTQMDRSTTVGSPPQETARIWTARSTESVFQKLTNAKLLRGVASATTRRIPLQSGGNRIVVEHQEVLGVTPEMMEWWFTHFPYVEILLPNQEIVSAYRLWHPFDHQCVRVKHHSLSGQLGMAVGAQLELGSTWGSFVRKSSLRVRRMDPRGLFAQFLSGPWVIAAIEEAFEKTSNGTLCVSSLTLGPSLCAFLRAPRVRRFGPGVLDAWVKHKVEEVGNLQHIVPQLYRSFSETVGRAGAVSDISNLRRSSR